MNKDIVIIGSNGFAKEVLFLIEDINKVNSADFQKPVYNVLGFINNEPNTWGTLLNGYPILGDDEWILNHPSRLSVVVGIGRPYIKRKIVQRLADRVDYPTLIHPSVIRSQHINFGKGVIITAGNVLTTNIKIKDHVMINLSCTIGHDTQIESYVVISPGTNVSGNVHVGEGSYIGTGATILEKIRIGNWATIGGAALINKDVNNNVTVVGVPAKEIKVKEDGWQDK